MYIELVTSRYLHARECQVQDDLCYHEHQEKVTNICMPLCPGSLPGGSTMMPFLTFSGGWVEGSGRSPI